MREGEGMKVKLGDICTFQSGGTPSKTNMDYFSGDIPWITTVALNGQIIGGDAAVDWITEKAIKESAAKIVPARSIMVGVRVGVGKVAINEIPMSTSQDIISLVGINESLWSKDFLCKFIQSKETYLKSQSRGATIKGIKIDVLASLDLPDVPFDEQQEIVAVLDKVQNILAVRRSQISALDNLIKARFVEMFGDPETNPMGWQQVTLGDVCSSIVRGPFGSALKKEFFVEPDETTCKVYEQKHAIRKSATIGSYYVTAEKYQELKRFECVSGDILMSCSGTMGELYQLPEGCERGIINQALCKFTLNEKIIPVCFLVYMRHTIGNLETKGSGIKNIAAVSYVKKMPINLPPMSVQKEFKGFCKQVDKSKSAIQKCLDETQALFDSLMQDYFG